MLSPEATAARSAREAECMKVPSPTFCTMCRSVRNGAIPVHWIPSPPIWVTPVTWPTCSSSIMSTIA